MVGQAGVEKMVWKHQLKFIIIIIIFIISKSYINGTF